MEQTFNTRSFNQIEIDQFRGTIFKRSPNNQSALVDEIAWYAQFPQELRDLLPSGIELSELNNRASIEMEVVQSPTMTDFMFKTLLQKEHVERLMSLLSKTLTRIHSFPNETPGKLLYFNRIYLSKTHKRILAYIDSPVFQCYRGSFESNGRTIRGLDYIMSNLAYIIKPLIQEPRPWTLIHGDFYPGNIFYDQESHTIKLIDPRGSFGIQGCSGDPRYDWAKLAHSFIYNYDGFIAGYYKIQPDGFDFEMSLPPYVRSMEQEFKTQFQKHCPYDFKQIQLICGLLFLSMVPLHSENIDNQRAFIIQGLKIIDEYLSETV